VRVAYFCHRIPYPPDKGDKIRAFYQLRGIASRHEVDLFTLVDDPRDVTHREALVRYCREVTAVRIDPRMARFRALPYLLTRTPLTVPCFYSSELNTVVRKCLLRRSYDRIVVYCSAMAQYVESITGIPVITDFVDVDSDKWAQYASYARFPMSAVYRREARCLLEYERKVCELSSSVIVTTEREKKLVRQMSDRANVHVITNGVDTEYFSDAAAPREATVPTVLFTGDMSYFPNEEAVVSFARNILPLIQKTIPETRFLIVGRNPTARVQQMNGIGRVEVTGYVPDVRTYLAKAHVSVAPFSIAAGIQNKIIEAMSYGLPIVATPRAVQGLTPHVGAIVQTASSHEQMAEEVLGLILDPELAQRKGAAGRACVAADYNWNRSLSQLLNLLENPAGFATSLESELHV
jgi:sugar transferase (PEP-CTERM/EpsH1 system associated)